MENSQGWYTTKYQARSHLVYDHATNNLLRSWNPRIKFVDDTTALEIIPRNSVSLLNFATNDIYAFSEDHKMKLNPTKCREMLINFMTIIILL